MAALAPEPPAPSDEDPTSARDAAAWKQMVEALDKRGERFHKAFINRLTRARRERANPPPMIKKQNFCTAENVDSSAGSKLDE
jgi:hypothetical protein